MTLKLNYLKRLTIKALELDHPTPSNTPTYQIRLTRNRKYI